MILVNFNGDDTVHKHGIGPDTRICIGASLLDFDLNFSQIKLKNLPMKLDNLNLLRILQIRQII